MKLLYASPFVFLLTLLAPAQAPIPRPTNNGLELQLQPQEIKKNVPEAFVFTLVNRSHHDIRLPPPSIECEGPAWDGGFFLRVNLKAAAGGEGFGGGCTNDKGEARPISERVKAWKTLHPGESITVKASKERLFYKSEVPGSYEFRAFYYPPVVSKSDREFLRQAGIVFPQRGLSTIPVKFFKQQ